jgi:isopentenyldiphosphate isomerase
MGTSEKVFCFFSFDLSNSTEYKTRAPDEWVKSIDSFYQEVLRSVEDYTEINCQLWKFLGDELVFYFEEPFIQDLIRIIPLIKKTIVTTKQALDNLTKTSFSLSVKAAVWIALVSEEQEKTRNIKYISPNYNQPNPHHESFDFLGPEIDAGFRLCSKAPAGRLLIGAKLAYMLMEDEAYAQKLRIVEYANLKGIWNGRGYPIIWFEEDWSKIKETFEYDAEMNSPLVLRITESICLNPNIKGLCTIKKANEAAFSDVKIIRSYLEGRSDKKKIIKPSFHQKAEVHCVAVCINKKDQVLTFLRSAQKALLPGTWDFGCSTIRNKKTIEETLVTEYQMNFSIKINRDTLKPIGTYYIQEKGIPGIIFSCMVEDTEIQLNDRKRSDYRWINKDEIADFLSQNNAVSDFKKSANAAFLSQMDSKFFDESN